MAIFLTGGTGYIGAHVAANLLEQHDATLNLLVRGRDPRDAELRLWQALQLHLPFPKFYEYLQAKIRIFRGDLTAPQFGLDRGRLRPARAHHRFGDPLRGFAESEVGKKLFERKSARDARSGAIGAAIAVLSRAAAVFECEHGGGGGETQPRSCYGRPVD